MTTSADTVSNQRSKACEFMAVPAPFLQPGQKLEFDLYTSVEGNFVLCAAVGSTLGQKMVSELRRNPAAAFYARTDDAAYLQYCESRLSRIVRNSQITGEVKAQIFHTIATNLAKNILQDPQSGLLIPRARQIVQQLSDLISTQKDVFFHLVRIASQDFYPFAHPVNICTLSVGLARRLGVRSPASYTALGLGALLHDVGECLIDPQILNRPGPLTAEERQLVRQHPEWGGKLLRGSSDLPADARQRMRRAANAAAPIDPAKIPAETFYVIEHHHESCNGQGYPYGLPNEKIHLFAKIVKVADIYDALVMKRYYQRRLTPFQAIQAMQEEALARTIDMGIFQEFILLLRTGTDQER